MSTHDIIFYEETRKIIHDPKLSSNISSTQFMSCSGDSIKNHTNEYEFQIKLNNKPRYCKFL